MGYEVDVITRACCQRGEKERGVHRPIHSGPTTGITGSRVHSDAAQVYDAAAAERARNDRRSIASRLRRSGVDVVDAPPEELAPALADHYLAMKASGRL